MVARVAFEFRGLQTRYTILRGAAEWLDSQGRLLRQADVVGSQSLDVSLP